MEIRLENLTKVFTTKRKGQTSTVVAVNNMNIDIPSGKLVGLLGPSGCGKSTLLNIIGNLDNKSSGEITFNNNSKNIGYMFQNDCLFPWLNI